MRRERRKIPDLPSPRKRLKWWVKNNYLYLIMVGGVCLVAALILIFEINRHERTRNMEALLQKSRRDMHWGGITDDNVRVLKKRYPEINWDSQYDRYRWQKGVDSIKERRGRHKAKQKLKR